MTAKKRNSLSPQGWDYPATAGYKVPSIQLWNHVHTSNTKQKAEFVYLFTRV